MRVTHEPGIVDQDVDGRIVVQDLPGRPFNLIHPGKVSQHHLGRGEWRCTGGTSRAARAARCCPARTSLCRSRGGTVRTARSGLHLDPRLLRPLRRPAEQDDFGAPGREGTGRHLADAAAGTGNNGCFTV